MINCKRWCLRKNVLLLVQKWSSDIFSIFKGILNIFNHPYWHKTIASKYSFILTDFWPWHTYSYKILLLVYDPRFKRNEFFFPSMFLKYGVTSKCKFIQKKFREREERNKEKCKLKMHELLLLYSIFYKYQSLEVHQHCLLLWPFL